MGEALHIHGMPDDTPCEIHDWTPERAKAELIPLMRARHGKGGVNVCTDCIERLRSSHDPKRSP